MVDSHTIIGLTETWREETSRLLVLQLNSYHFPVHTKYVLVKTQKDTLRPIPKKSNQKGR